MMPFGFCEGEVPMLFRGGSRSGKFWLFIYTERLSRVSEVYSGMAERAGGAKRWFRVPGCRSVLSMLVIGYGGNTAALGQERYLSSDI